MTRENSKSRQPDPPVEFVSLGEMARRIGFSKEALRAWAHARLVSYSITGGRMIFNPEVVVVQILVEAMRKQRQAGTTPRILDAGDE